MRADHNRRKWAKHPEWYTHELGHMFVPTNECPENVKKAMDKYNSYTYPEEYKNSKMKKHD